MVSALSLPVPPDRPRQHRHEAHQASGREGGEHGQREQEQVDARPSPLARVGQRHRLEERWNRRWDERGQPYAATADDASIRPATFPGAGFAVVHDAFPSIELASAVQMM